jgi:hypothetical protein
VIRRVLVGAGLVFLLAGVGYIDVMPTWVLAVFIAAMALVCIVGWIWLERQADRDAGVR